MRQNLVSVRFTAAELADTDAALDTLERVLAKPVQLDAKQRQSARKMGGKSETFVRQTLNVMTQNKPMVPEAFNLPEALDDLATFDQLRPRLARLQQLGERVTHTSLGLGSDLMVAATDGYKMLQSFGKSDGLDALREAISARFARKPKQKVPPAAA